MVVFLAALVLQVHAQDDAAADRNDGYAFSGYSCDRDCSQGGDVNFVIAARLNTYEIPGATCPEDGPCNAMGGTPEGFSFPGTASVLTRTFEGVSGPFCDSGATDGSTGMLGPCLQVQPGQRLTIQIVNELDGGMAALDQTKASREGYWEQTQIPGYPDLDQIAFPATADYPYPTGTSNATLGWLGDPVETPDDMALPNVQNFPGWDAPGLFDYVNIHLHGMQVVPHLFYPQGTSDPAAPWIETIPGDPERKCFCWVFDVPEDHPQGQFWWHIHRHGSVAMQGWQGMLGELLVTGPKSPSEELAAQGVTKTVPLIPWEFPFGSDSLIEGTNATFTEANFIDGGGDVLWFPVNDEVMPLLTTIAANETLHMRTLCAQATTGMAIYVIDAAGNHVPLWVFASDGISYSQAVKHDMVVIGTGQREAILVQIAAVGTATVYGLVLNDFQNQQGGPNEAGWYGEPVFPGDEIVLATIEVTTESDSTSTQVDISSLRFSPGMEGKEITAEDIKEQLSVNFQVNSNLDALPIPQFVIDGEAFNVSETSRYYMEGDAQQWQLTSDMNYFHPFHIHVNPFQVKGYKAGLLVGPANFTYAVSNTNLDPVAMWRDTIFIPPFGDVTIWQRFEKNEQWIGKTVFHCHFLDHEDQGMMSNFILELDEEASNGQ